MNKPTTFLLAAAALLGALAQARVASAQRDVNPAPPNVMLLVDTSGSMEYKASSSEFPVCDPLIASNNEKSRWIELVEVLTGDINDYRCDKVDRNSDSFKAEYMLGSTPSPDYRYPNPYHRPLSGNCTVGPGTLTTNAYEFPSTALSFHLYNSVTSPCSTFAQQNNGILDSFSNRVRFGLMTFDTSTNEKTGVAGTSADYPGGVEGTWSYFVGLQPAQGMPAGCLEQEMQEVGARNAAAPPWEGRMIAFGNPNAGLSVLSTKNQQIQQVLLASRPYGATPIAGMMDDALEFFWNDQTKDPLIPEDDFGPYNDPFVKDECRKSIIVLVTDGEPNLDLRPFCEGPGGICPYEKKPEETAFELASASADKRVQTFVIGLASPEFTLGDGTAVDCTNMSSDDLTGATGLCATQPSESALQVCCTLHRIAFNGGTSRARFGDTKKTLRDEISKVLSDAMPVASRTLPVVASSSNANGPLGAAFRFFTSFNPQPFDLWKGVIERQRFVCEKDVNGVFQPVPQLIDPARGDDFVNNVNSDPAHAENRRFISVTGELDNGAIHSERSIRPQLGSANDGAGNYGGTAYQGAAAAFATGTDYRAMAITTTTCDAEPNQTNCKERLMRWNVGLPNDDDEHRCRAPGSNCNLIGDLYHSTPVVVGPPSAFIRDETYDSFAIANAERPLVLYTSTNDGFLHAFEVEVDSVESNELWAFLPPAVLPAIASQYAKTHQNLLDGVPVVKDVVARLRLNDQDRFEFERGVAEARGASGTWRTVLVQSFGMGRPGYFAIDITDPNPSTEPGDGPQFLWQLTTDATGNPLFGTGGATPLITSVFIEDDSGAREVAVAVLPGGGGPSPSAGAEGNGCARTTTQFPWVDAAFAPRQRVRCYEGQGVQGRSLTIVRLDTGEILKTFRRDASEVPAGVAAASSGGLVEEVPDLISPITGPPVAFPSQVGAVADRVFVGDADGTLWRVNLTSRNPANWTMRIFWDAYPGGTQNHDFDDGQPIMIPPVVSLDRLGNVTVALATGDQEVLTAPSGMSTYVWSLTEAPNGDNDDFIAKPNWYLGGPGLNDPRRFVNGERVTGPITLFNEGLYFSTYTPPDPSGGDVCAIGTSRIWGVHYLDRDVSEPLENGGRPLLERPGVTPPELVQFLALAAIPGAPADAVIFGVSLVQLPTCFDDVTTDEDPYTGSGTFRRMSNVTPGKFQLVMHTGSAGNTQTGGQTGVTTLNVPSPTSVTEIDSWAAIVE